MTATGDISQAVRRAVPGRRLAEPFALIARAGSDAGRRTSAIMAADIVGYSRLMAADETGTFARLKSLRADVFDPALERWSGRVVKTMGDGLLVELGGGVHAVGCAVEIQDGLRRVESGRHPERRIDLRIGINLGEVIVEEGDVFGTVVNVAARLEALAEPGGITVSGAVFWAVPETVRQDFVEMGFLRLRNIPHPVEVYRLARPGVAARAGPQVPRVWSEAKTPHPSVVVMPFDNMSGDAGQDYFCDGLTLDLTTDLARFSNLIVIDRNSALGFKRQGLPPADLRRTLGVEYLVEGGVQRSDDRVRVTARLVATATSRQLWVERVTRRVEDLFDLQSAIAARIAGTLGARLGVAETVRAVQGETGSIDAYVAFLRGLHCMHCFLEVEETADTLARSRAWFDRALAIDPDYARAWGWLAYSHVQGWLHGWEAPEALETAEARAQHAVALDPTDHDTHWALASVLSNMGRHDEALPSYERALELNPNDADLHAEMAELISFSGRHADAIDRVRFAMHLNPLFPAWYRWILGWCLYFVGAHEEALGELDKLPHAVDEVLLIRAASHARLGARGGCAAAQHAEAARDAVDTFLERRPGWTVSRQRDVTRLRREDDMEHWLGGLRLAGLPES